MAWKRAEGAPFDFAGDMAATIEPLKFADRIDSLQQAQSSLNLGISKATGENRTWLLQETAWNFLQRSKG